MPECFTVIADEIEGRIDPFYYRPEFREFDKKISSGKIKLKQIQEISKVICGPFGSSITAKDYKSEGVPFIRISNIEEDHLSKFDIVYISEELSKKLKSYIVKEGDLIISQRGTLGLVVNVGKDFDGSVISANFIAIKDLREISPDFLQILLSSKFGQTQLIRKTSGQVQAKITTDDIKTFKVPIPSEEKQKKIISYIKRAYSYKANKETEAQKLLGSINDYILDELGIKLPELNDKMAYVVDSAELQNKRVDPYYYQPKFEEGEKEIKKGKFDVKELRECFEKELIKGILPNEEEKIGDVKVLQIKNILRNGFIDTNEYVTSKNIFSPEHKIKKGEVIVVVTGATIGKVGLWKSNEEFYLGGDMIKFGTNGKFNPNFIQALLLSELGRFQLSREITGATNKHLSPSDVEQINIPVPSIAFQNKIAEEVKRRMQKAEQLQNEAKDELEEAKRHVEKIILGEI